MKKDFASVLKSGNSNDDLRWNKIKTPHDHLYYFVKQNTKFIFFNIDSINWQREAIP